MRSLAVSDLLDNAEAMKRWRAAQLRGMVRQEPSLPSIQRRRMILSTSSGDFPIPAEVARQLPNVPALPDASAADARLQIEDFRHW